MRRKDQSSELPVNDMPAVTGLARARKRFLVTSLAGLFVASISMGVSFTADTGVTTVTAASTGGSLPLVWSANYSSGGGLPAAVDTATASAGLGWKYGTGLPSKPTAPVFPTIVAGQAGSITSSGDIAVIDATDTSATYLLVTIYITNMHELSLTYNSYSLPFRIYSGTLSSGQITWASSAAVDSNLINTANTYITNNSGYETFKLATHGNQYYEVTLDSGGSYYAYQTGASGAATTPALYITAQRTS